VLISIKRPKMGRFCFLYFLTIVLKYAYKVHILSANMDDFENKLWKLLFFESYSPHIGSEMERV